jgi:hypothetical protein
MSSMGKPSEWLKSKQKDEEGLNCDERNEKHVKFDKDRLASQKNAKVIKKRNISSKHRNISVE